MLMTGVGAAGTSELKESIKKLSAIGSSCPGLSRP
jgi:hypothetical protein